MKEDWSDEEFCLKKVKEDGENIQYCINPSEEVKLEAVKEWGWNILYIDNPSEQVCRDALRQDPKLIDVKYLKQLYYSEEALEEILPKFNKYPWLKEEFKLMEM